MNIINFVKNNVEKYPTKIAIIDEDTSITFQKLYEEIQNFSTSISFLNEKDVSVCFNCAMMVFSAEQHHIQEVH